jgi:hypothetical protein
MSNRLARLVPGSLLLLALLGIASIFGPPRKAWALEESAYEKAKRECGEAKAGNDEWRGLCLFREDEAESRGAVAKLVRYQKQYQLSSATRIDVDAWLGQGDFRYGEGVQIKINADAKKSAAAALELQGDQEALANRFDNATIFYQQAKLKYEESTTRFAEGCDKFYLTPPRDNTLAAWNAYSRALELMGITPDPSSIP